MRSNRITSDMITDGSNWNPGSARLARLHKLGQLEIKTLESMDTIMAEKARNGAESQGEAYEEAHRLLGMKDDEEQPS